MMGPSSQNDGVLIHPLSSLPTRNLSDSKPSAAHTLRAALRAGMPTESPALLNHRMLHFQDTPFVIFTLSLPNNQDRSRTPVGPHQTRHEELAWVSAALTPGDVGAAEHTVVDLR